MENKPYWKANSGSANHKVPSSMEPQVSLKRLQEPTLVPFLTARWNHSLHFYSSSFRFCFIYINIYVIQVISSSIPFPCQNVVLISQLSRPATYTTHLILFYLIALIMFSEECKLYFPYYALFFSLLSSFLAGRNILICALRGRVKTSLAEAAGDLMFFSTLIFALFIQDTEFWLNVSKHVQLIILNTLFAIWDLRLSRVRKCLWWSSG
jgi:hypothetical protein